MRAAKDVPPVQAVSAALEPDVLTDCRPMLEIVAAAQFVRPSHVILTVRSVFSVGEAELSISSRTPALAYRRLCRVRDGDDRLVVDAKRGDIKRQRRHLAGIGISSLAIMTSRCGASSYVSP